VEDLVLYNFLLEVKFKEYRSLIIRLDVTWFEGNVRKFRDHLYGREYKSNTCSGEERGTFWSLLILNAMPFCGFIFFVRETLHVSLEPLHMQLGKDPTFIYVIPKIHNHMHEQIFYGMIPEPQIIHG
jgi:hypothetical protein